MDFIKLTVPAQPVPCGAWLGCVASTDSPVTRRLVTGLWVEEDGHSDYSGVPIRRLEGDKACIMAALEC